MRYAAKRTWPDRPKAWEQHGEADNIEAFALTFASDYGLGVGTEFEVLDKDSDDAALVPYRVTCTIPYTLGPVEAHKEQKVQTVPPAATPASVAGAAFSFGFYMVKVAMTIMVVMAILFYLIKQIQ
jgi:hypothetical protein